MIWLSCPQVLLKQVITIKNTFSYFSYYSFKIPLVINFLFLCLRLDENFNDDYCSCTRNSFPIRLRQLLFHGSLHASSPCFHLILVLLVCSRNLLNTFVLQILYKVCRQTRLGLDVLYWSNWTLLFLMPVQESYKNKLVHTNLY